MSLSTQRPDTSTNSARFRHARVKFSEDEQQVTAGGHSFVAQENTTGLCIDCAFTDGFGCALWRSEIGSSMCSSKSRADGRSIIWIAAHAVSQ